MPRALIWVPPHQPGRSGGDPRFGMFNACLTQVITESPPVRPYRALAEASSDWVTIL
jgi:hypothetical protein